LAVTGKAKHESGFQVPEYLNASPQEALLRLAAIVESTDDVIISKDLNGTITSWNPAAERIFGYHADEIIGKSILTLIPEELHPEETEILRKLSAGERIEHYETVRVSKHGVRVPVSLTISPIRDLSGRVVGASKIARDLSERVQADRAQFHLAAIVESSDDAIASKDLNGIITSWNFAAEKLFGWKAEEMVGRSVLTIIPPELHYQEPDILRKLRAGERIEHYETERLRKNGERVWVSLTISPIKDPTGRIIGASKIARDISERKRVQEALIQSEKLAATGRMAAAIAHEINNPLEAVTNLAYLLTTDTSINATARSYAQMMLDEVARASHITKQTLAFYRESGTPVPFDVRDLMDNVLALNRPALEKRGLQVVKEYRGAEPIYGYPAEMRQVFANLLLNAIDASPDGGTIRVRVSCDRKRQNGEQQIRVTVADTGSGVPVQNRRRLFEPFFTTKGHRGNGLGLWVSLGIVQKHGGRIRLRSSTEHNRSGTVFSVLLPIGGISADRNNLSQWPPPPESSRTISPTKPLASPKSIRVLSK
jgi:PAS domain S-box-containing protein